MFEHCTWASIPRLLSAGPGLLHKIRQTHAIDRRFAFSVGDEVYPPAVGGKHRFGPSGERVENRLPAIG